MAPGGDPMSGRSAPRQHARDLCGGPARLQSAQVRLLAPLLAGVGVPGVLDDQVRLRALAAPEDARASLLFGDHSHYCTE